MQSILTCPFAEHPSEPIIGICLDPQCLPHLQCTRCLLSSNPTNNENIRLRNCLSSLIGNSMEKLIEQITKFGQYIERLSALFQDIKKSLFARMEKMENLFKQINAFSYQDIVNYIKSLKVYEELVKSKENVYSIKLLGKLEKWHHFCKTLNSLDIFKGYDSLKQKNTEDLEELSQFIFQKGKSFYENDQLNHALMNFDECIKIKSDNYYEALIYKGCILNEMQRYEEAILCYDEVISYDINNQIALNNKGLSLLKLNQYEKAKNCFETALKLDPEDEFAQVNLGVSLIKLHRKNEAQQYFQKVLIKNPEMLFAIEQKQKQDDILQQSETYIDDDYREQEEKKISKPDNLSLDNEANNVNQSSQISKFNNNLTSSQINGRQKHALQKEGVIKLILGNILILNDISNSDVYFSSQENFKCKFIIANTLSCYRIFGETTGLQDRKLKLNFSYPQRFLNEGVSLFILQKYKEAVQLCDQALKFNSKDVEAYIFKGFILHTQQKYLEALINFEKAIKLNASKFWSPDIIFETLFEIEKNLKAQRNFNTAIPFKSQLPFSLLKFQALQNFVKFKEAVQLQGTTIDLRFASNHIGEDL